MPLNPVTAKRRRYTFADRLASQVACTLMRQVNDQIKW